MKNKKEAQNNQKVDKSREIIMQDIVNMEQGIQQKRDLIVKMQAEIHYMEGQLNVLRNLVNSTETFVLKPDIIKQREAMKK